MTPQEKAKELVDKLELNIPQPTDGYYWDCTEKAKQCALIAVDEILKLNHHNVIVYHRSDSSELPNNITIEEMTQEYYWTQVKQEIEKL